VMLIVKGMMKLTGFVTVIDLMQHNALNAVMGNSILTLMKSVMMISIF